MTFSNYILKTFSTFKQKASEEIKNIYEKIRERDKALKKVSVFIQKQSQIASALLIFQTAVRYARQ